MLNQRQAQCSQGFILDSRASRIMSPTYNYKTEKCETVIRANQMSFRLSLLCGTFSTLRVGMKHPLLGSGSFKCKCESWNSSINRAGLNGRRRWCPEF